ncbi:keratin, type I cytoskeletal 10 isoform X10 [Xiphophorus hellerii]|uniref:keratin, type I cytoskeletal 10 isoform X10 n=1 Tax=Xiphophorus hellerii TaxID=8084 RepID=UPI0013B433CE|nr:keratin, type I cytoskeletal 10-like isoform X10 [Xiphophorus hellerii]
MKPACHAEVRGVPVRWKLPHAARHSSGSRADGASRAPISFPVFTCRLTCSALQQTSQILQCATCSSSDVFQKADPPLVAEADADRRMFRGESWMKECLWKQRPGWRRQAAVGVLLGKPGVYIGGEDVSAAAFCLFFCLFLPAGSIMLLRALLQTSLVLWLAQQTLQGGVSPQNVAFGRALPVRGVGVGVKPGVTGALGAVGNRYGTKAMKTGLGRYPAAHLGVGGYRSLGLGGRGGLKPGGYGTPAGYGASLGTGMGLNAGLTNGLGLGQAGKRVYGAGLGQLPGYGAFPGIGYQGVRPGVSAADLGGPEGASLAQAAQDLKREKIRAVDEMLGEREQSLRRSNAFGPTVPRIHARIEVKRLNPSMPSSNLRPSFPLDKQNKILGGKYELGGHEAMLAGAGINRQLPVDQDVKSLDSYNSGLHNPRETANQDATNCGAPAGLPEMLGINPSEVKAGKRFRCKNLPAQGQDGRSDVFFPVQRQAGISPLTAPESSQDLQRCLAQDKIRVRDGSQRYNPIRAQSLGVTLTREEQEVGGFTQEDARLLPIAGHVSRKSKPLRLPEQTERNTQAASYIGGAGNYLGTAGYGAGLGQGAYLGGAAGKLSAAAALGQGAYPQGVAGKSNGYGDGVTGYLGAMAGNGFGYGNGYGDGYGAALSTGGYAGPVQGGYGGLGTGLESVGGDGGYPYAAQQLGLAAESAKTASKYGAAAGFGTQQTGFGAALGASQDALMEQTGKYDGLNAGLGNGYKG